MKRVRVKIEGLRDAATAVRIAQMGADAIGLVFAPSPRQVTANEARRIVRALPPWVSTVGVFVNADAAAINAVADEAGLSHVQLHGDEGPEMLGLIRRPCIKAFRVRDENWLAQVRQWLAGTDRSNLAAILLDAFSPAVRGGSGARFNWNWIADARSAGELGGLDPLVLAGGMDASCVGSAIQVVRPWAVDVASGVESSPGVKDLQKVQDFLQAVQSQQDFQSEFWG